jgi:hypothetical protein
MTRIQEENEDRANRAQAALNAYDETWGGHDGSTEEQIIDLIADLNHLARREGVDFAVVLRCAQLHVNAE